MLVGVIASSELGLVNVNINGHLIEGVSSLEPGVQVCACIRPEEVTLALVEASNSARNTFSGTITGITSTGPLVRVTVDCDFPLIALITTRSAEDLELHKGMNVCASFKATGVNIVEG